jgi:hypothetical protein
MFADRRFPRLARTCVLMNATFRILFPGKPQIDNARCFRDEVFKISQTRPASGRASVLIWARRLRTTQDVLSPGSLSNSAWTR